MSPPIPPLRPSRRSVLATGAGLLGASASGCQLPGGTSKGATDVVVHNETTGAISVALTITDAGAERPRLDRTLDLESTEQATPTDDGKLPVSADYTVEVDVVDGPRETYQWQDVRLELAPLHVLVDGSSNVVFALQSG